MTTLTVPTNRARADVNTVLAITGTPQVRHHADIRVVGRQLRAKAHRALAQDRGKRCTEEREAPPGTYATLPAWWNRDQWLVVVEAAAIAWFPEKIHRKVSVATLLKFAALAAAHADDATGQRCRRWYSDLARGMGVTEETVRKCWRALEELGLAVQVLASEYFSREKRMQLWRQGSKQRGQTPEYALVVPAAYARAVETGEHPADLLAQEYTDSPGIAGTERLLPKSAAPAQKLSAALRALRAASPAPLAPEPVQPSPTASTADEENGSGVPTGSAPATAALPSPQRPVDNHRFRSTTRLENVDILGLPRSGTRPTYLSCLALVSSVPPGGKSSASRAHNRGGRTDSTRPGGPRRKKGTQKPQVRSGGWYGAHRDIAVVLTRHVLWLKPLRDQPGRIAMQLKRYAEPGLPKVWTPRDFMNAFDAINRRQGRYSPGANLASTSKTDQAHATVAASGAVNSPTALLKWYLAQIDPVNDHPRFELECSTARIQRIEAARRAAEEAHERHLAELGLERGSAGRAEVRQRSAALARDLMGLPPVTRLRNRK